MVVITQSDLLDEVIKLASEKAVSDAVRIVEGDIESIPKVSNLVFMAHSKILEELFKSCPVNRDILHGRIIRSVQEDMAFFIREEMSKTKKK